MEFQRLTWGVIWKTCEESLEEFGKYVVTKNERADGAFSVQKFPLREDKPYLWDFLDHCCTETMLCVEKSRQLMLTWGSCLYILWQCKFHANRFWFVQSKKEEDAANLVFNMEPNVARISFMESNLPIELRSPVSWSYGKAIYRNGSRIWAIPEGGEKIRSYTASGLFSDEYAFQPEAEEAFKAARPAGSQLILVSSARPGAYMRQLIREA